MSDTTPAMPPVQVFSDQLLATMIKHRFCTVPSRRGTSHVTDTAAPWRIIVHDRAVPNEDFAPIYKRTSLLLCSKTETVDDTMVLRSAQSMIYAHSERYSRPLVIMSGTTLALAKTVDATFGLPILVISQFPSDSVEYEILMTVEQRKQAIAKLTQLLLQAASATGFCLDLVPLVFEYGWHTVPQPVSLFSWIEFLHTMKP